MTSYSYTHPVVSPGNVLKYKQLQNKPRRIYHITLHKAYVLNSNFIYLVVIFILEINYSILNYEFNKMKLENKFLVKYPPI